MPFGLSLALAALAQAASPGLPAAPPPQAPPGPAADTCRNSPPGTDPRTIVVCAPRPQGYRIDPDVLEAHREHRNQSNAPRGRETFAGSDCAVVGPMGCRGGPTIDLVNAAAVLAKMAATASQGGDVGKMFETTPEMSEYQLYVEAKKRREAKEAQAAAAKAKARALAAQRAPHVVPTVPAQTSSSN